MVVTVKSLTVAEIFKKIGVTEAQELALGKAGISPKLTHNSLKFLGKSDSGTGTPLSPLAQLMFKPSTMLKLQQGVVDPAFKEKLMATIDQLLKQKPPGEIDTLAMLDPDPAIMAHFENNLAEIAGQDPAHPKPSPPKTSEPKTSEPKAGETKASQQGYPIFDLDQLGTAETCKLRDATAMYQPVTGTSKNSRYFLVAANASLRVAARLQGHSLSVRIEGPNWKANVAKMVAAGVDNVHGEQEYASIHVSSSDHVLLNKALGAILFGLQMHWDTPFPDLKLIANQGA